MRHAYNFDLAPEAAERERDRLPADFHAGVIDEDGASIEVRVRNLSCLGFMAETHATLKIGSWIVLRTRQRAHQARVQWDLEGRFGCAFDRELDWAEVLRLAASRS